MKKVANNAIVIKKQKGEEDKKNHTIDPIFST